MEEYRHDWREAATPAGRAIPKLLSEQRRHRQADGQGIVGWATPKASEPGGYSERALWEMIETGATAGHHPDLTAQAQLAMGQPVPVAGWPTPTGSTGGPEPEGVTGRKLVTVARRTGSPTPDTASRQGGLQADPEAALVGWGTPTASDHKDGMLPDARHRSQLKFQVHGTSTSSSGPPGSGKEASGRGGLNPELSRWLNGLPRGWSMFAPSAGLQRSSPQTAAGRV